MTAQLNSAGLEETPLFIPFKTFETQDSCMDYACLLYTSDAADES